MENSLKGLILAAGVVITCVVVGLGFYLSREASNSGNEAISQIAGMTAEYGDVSKTMYENVTVSGNEVLAAINKFSSDISDGTLTVTVYTGKKTRTAGGITFSKDSFDIASSKTKTSVNYINPTGSFDGEIVRDDNGAVSQILFTQK